MGFQSLFSVSEQIVHASTCHFICPWPFGELRVSDSLKIFSQFTLGR